MKQTSAPHRIVIVGGGAGGLELATRLGDKLGRSGRASITLIDRARTHLWKPLLHEVAAGSMDFDTNALPFAAQAHWHSFTYITGAMDGLDRAGKKVAVAPTLDEHGEEVIPRRLIAYDTLVIAVGSLTNTFNTPGVSEHAYSLDTAEDADRFHSDLINACIRANFRTGSDPAGHLHVVIVGGGATGVELAAELHASLRHLAAYGLENIEPARDIRITLINADKRILSALPEHLSQSTHSILEALKIEVLCNEMVTEVTGHEVITRSGRRIPSNLTVWAAGIKAAEFLRDLDGLETNRLNQLVVLPTLQTTRDPDIFAFGDCAAAPWGERDKQVPPRAQAAHQQAAHLYRTMLRRLENKPPQPYVYRDFGSLISLGRYTTVGNLMGMMSRGSIRIEGFFARIMYVSLYKMHLVALHGVFKTALDTLARVLKRRTEPRVKLH